MKNLQLTSRKTNAKVLTALASVGFFAIAGELIGCFVPAAACALAVISVGLAVFVWSIFRLIKPGRYDRSWNLAEVILVPLCWLMLLLAVYVSLGWAINRWNQELQNITQSTLRN